MPSTALERAHSLLSLGTYVQMIFDDGIWYTGSVYRVDPNTVDIGFGPEETETKVPMVVDGEMNPELRVLGTLEDAVCDAVEELIRAVEDAERVRADRARADEKAKQAQDKATLSYLNKCFESRHSGTGAARWLEIQRFVSQQREGPPPRTPNKSKKINAKAAVPVRPAVSPVTKSISGARTASRVPKNGCASRSDWGISAPKSENGAAKGATSTSLSSDWSPHELRMLATLVRRDGPSGWSSKAAELETGRNDDSLRCAWKRYGDKYKDCPDVRILSSEVTVATAERVKAEVEVASEWKTLKRVTRSKGITATDAEQPPQTSRNLSLLRPIPLDLVTQLTGQGMQLPSRFTDE